MLNDLFHKYQHELLKLANSTHGRRLLGIDKEYSGRIIKLTPNSYAYRNGDKITEVFRCYPLFSNRLGVAITETDIAIEQYKDLGEYQGLLHYSGVEESHEFPQIYLATGTFYTGAGDGHVAVSGAQDTWATQKAKTTGDSLDYTSATTTVINQQNAGGTFIYRIFLPFDTSTLGAGATVTAATCSIYGQANYGTSNVAINLVATSQATATELVANDFDNITLTGLSTEVATPISNAAYTDFALSDMTKISKTTYTKLGIAGKQDIENTNPLGGAGGHTIHSSEATGTANDPKLVVTYTPAPGGGFLLNFI